MQSQDLQKLIDDSPLYTLLWKWMNSINPEEAEGNLDGFAFMSTGGKLGPDKSVFTFSLVRFAQDKGYRLGRLVSPCLIKYANDAINVHTISRPYYYRYGVEYAILYLEPELQKIHFVFYSELQQRMMSIHSKAFVSLQSLLEEYKPQMEHQKEIQSLKENHQKELQELKDKHFKEIQDMSEEFARHMASEDEAFTRYFTRDRIIEHLANRREGDRTDAKLELLEAILPTPIYENLCDDIDERRAEKQSRRQNHYNKSIPSPAPTQINVQGDYVIDKKVDHQINQVEAGATGINVITPKKPY